MKNVELADARQTPTIDELQNEPTTDVPTIAAQTHLNEILAGVKTVGISTSIQALQVLLDEFPHYFQGWRELGMLYRQAQKRDAALKAFQRAEALVPNHQWIGVACAVELRSLGQIDTAIAKLNRILEKQPKNVAAWFALGVSYRRQQKRAQAARAFEKALRVNPEHFSSNLQLASTYKDLDRLDQAQTILDQLSKSHPDSFQVCLELGYLHQKKGQREAAIAYFEAARGHSQNPGQALEALGQVALEYCDSGELDKAESLLTSALAQQPEHPLTLQTLARVYQQKAQTEESIEYYHRAIAADPDNISSRLQLSAIWRRRRDYPRAKQQLEAALLVKENHLRTLLNLASLACDQRDYPQALAYCQQAIQAHPNQLAPHLQKTDILRLSHQFDQAKTHLEPLLEAYPDHPRIYLKLGQIARQQGQRQQALSRFKQAWQHTKNPQQQASTQLLIIEELQALHRLDEAIDQVQKFLHQHPDHTRATTILGNLLQAQLKHNEAEAVYRAAIAKDPADLTAQLGLANILSDTHRIAEAIALLENLNRTWPRNFQVLMRLGYLNRATEQWRAASYWYRLTKKHYPYKVQVYGALAEVLYLQGNIKKAMSLLIEAADRFPEEPDIPLRLANLKLLFGLPDESRALLEQTAHRFPANVPICLSLCRLYVRLGQFEQAEHLLATIESDQGGFVKQIAQIKGNIAIAQLDFAATERYFAQSLTVPPTTTFEHQRLALALALQGKIDEAHASLIASTQLQHESQSPRQKGQAISSHIAALVNQMRINLPFLSVLQQTQADSSLESGPDRLLTLGSLIVQEPAYLGASAFLCKELRQQGIFDRLRSYLFAEAAEAHTSENDISSQIPKRIVQYWDAPTPPDAVLTVSSSWQEKNPDYDYIRFSLESATDFLRSHYNPDVAPDVLQAFKNCDHAATQADLFRLAYLNKMGGFYADADDRCRTSLDPLAKSKAELIVYQEENACIGNNFIGCTPGQRIIQSALYQAVENLLCYNNEGPWMQTGPGLLTASLCSHLLPYLAQTNYRIWPRIAVFSQESLRRYAWWGLNLPYKYTLKNWKKAAYDGPT